MSTNGKSLFIKKLRLHGFKAFGDPTTLDFEPGVVAFAGPNGCGKSNLVDAIRWVMGEQRSSDLRGNRLEDLIFHGSSKSRQSNYAEVSITLDNKEKIIHSPFSQLTVVRRVYRSGESECFINKTACRLKDITQLLGTFIGKSGRCIVAQGKVEEIASSNPEIKRKILEEVAGVDRFREKNREYERQIQQSSANLSRLSDILRGMRKQEQNLKIQAEQCKDFFALKKDLRELEIQNAVFDFWDLEKKKEHLKGSLQELQKKKQLKNDVLNEHNEKKRQAREIIAKDQKIVAELEKKQIEHTSKENVLIEKANTRKKLTELNKNRLEEIKQEIKNIDLSHKNIEQNIKDIDNKRSGFSDEIKKIAQDIVLAKKNKEDLVEQSKSCEETQIAKKKKIPSLKVEVQNHKKEIMQTTETILVKLRRIANHDIISDLNDHKKMQALKQEEEKLINAVEDLRKSISNPVEIKKISVDVDHLHELLCGFVENNSYFRKSLSGELVGFKEVLDEYEKRKELMKTIEEKEKSIDTLGFEIVEEGKKREKISQKIYDAKSLIYKLEIDQKSCMAKDKDNDLNLKRCHEEISQLKRRLEKAKENENICFEELEKMRQEEESLKEQKITDISKDKEIEKELAEQRQKQKKNTDFLRELEQKAGQIVRENEFLINEIGAHNSKIELVNNDIFHLQKNIDSRHRVNLLEESQKMVAQKPSFERLMEKIKKSIRVLQEKIERKGKINPLALEEYEEIKKQIETLLKEKEDVESSMADLKKLSDTLKKNSGEAFLKSFNQVNKVFSELIAELFVGGKGELRLQGNEEDPLEAGVEIRVEPKGKHMQSIDLFSGGEKTLIALSFLFSLFLARRTPFCIFDEVDAALDNENVLRFIKMLKKYQDKTQFIIVSHNQNTFSIVDFVYGVSMKEGVSSVFSLKVPT